MAGFGWRNATCLLVMLAPACVVQLADRNSPLENGGVTGDPADCSTLAVVPRAGVGTIPELRYVGRYNFVEPNRVYFDWSGNYISARFTGTDVSAGLELGDQGQPDILFTVVVDGNVLPDKLHVVPDRKQYLLAGNLAPGVPHEIVIHRNTEAQKGITLFTGFTFGGGGQLLPPTVRPRRIEIIGDSITCGYGNEGANATCPFDVEVRKDAVTGKPVSAALTENQFLAYGSLVGRALDADVTTVCWSGKGVYQNYRENPDDVDRLLTVPQAWRERTIATQGLAGNPPGPVWDFNTERPDEKAQAVVINLGTNDFTRDTAPIDNVPDGTIDRQAFRDALRDLVADVRRLRPDSHIFMAVPPMITDQYPIDNARSDHRNALRSVVDEFAQRGDRKVYMLELVEQGFRYGLGCDYHPNLEVHRIMAEQVTGAIRSKLCW